MGELDYLVRCTDVNILLIRQPWRMSNRHNETRDVTYAALCKTGIRSWEVHVHNHRAGWRKARNLQANVTNRKSKPFLLNIIRINRTWRIYQTTTGNDRICFSWDTSGHRERKVRAELGTCSVRRLTVSQALAMSSFILSSEVVQASSAVVSGTAFIGMDNGRDSRNRRH